MERISLPRRDLANGAHVDDEEEAARRIELEVPREPEPAEGDLLNLARMHRIVPDVEHRDVAAAGVARVEAGPVAVDLGPAGQVAPLVELGARQGELAGGVVAIDDEAADVGHARVDERQLR